MSNIRLTTEEYIERACEVHNNRYDYSKTVYVKSEIKLIIICPEHGEFIQNPHGHLSGAGCPKCGGSYMDVEFFIEKAREIHGTKFDYSKSVYVNAITKLIIICPEHGEFPQIPSSHLNGAECPVCKGGVRSNTKDFISKAEIVHNNLYDYSKSNYTNNSTHIIIICPEHGEFKQMPSNHLRNFGCPMCKERGFKVLPYKEAKEYIKKLNLKSSREYYIWWNNNKELCRKIGLSKAPEQFYTYKRKNK